MDDERPQHSGAGLGHAEATRYLVLEYLEGTTLEARLRAQGSGLKGGLALEEVLRIAIEIASALDAAHRAGITHRDLKPGNIFLTKAGSKLLDFGLAKAGGPAVAGVGGARGVVGLSELPTMGAALTQEGTILGTFQYMAPEQVEGEDADARFRSPPRPSPVRSQPAASSGSSRARPSPRA